MRRWQWIRYLGEKGMKGLGTKMLRSQWKIGKMKKTSRDRYLQGLAGTEDINFLWDRAADGCDSDSEISDDTL